MSTKGYTLVPTDDYNFQENISIFNYGDKNDLTDKYKSVFTYGKNIGKDYNYEGADKNKSTDRMLANMCHFTLIFWSYIILIVTFPLTAWFCLKKISVHERVVLFRLGRLQPVKGPGIACILPWIDSWKKVNILIRGFIIPPQQLILRDGSIVEIGGEIRFQVEDVVKTVTEVEDLDTSVRLLGQTLLVDLFQQTTISELQSDKYIISTNLHDRLKDIVLPWGIKIVQVELTQPKVLQTSTSKTNCSALDMLMSSLQSMMQNNSPLQSLQPVQNQNNVIHSLMVDKIFPTLMNSSAICGQDGGCVYKLVVEGQQGGVYWLDTKKGRTAAGDEQNNDMEPPDVTVTLSDSDFLAIINSTLTPFQAYIGGKIRVSGDGKMLYGLQSILRTLQTTVSNIERSQHSTSKIRII
ncbi:Stomatin [Chamberlinius hualienensis]